MFTHSAIWAALDGLAERYKLSPSGLARAAGLDATTFNKSKRFTTSGRERWPSTESLAKVLEATGASFDEFISLLVSAHPNVDILGRFIPLIDMDLASRGDVFDSAGLPVSDSWDEINFPEVRDEHMFALEVVVDDYEPVYWAGDILVVSPQAELRRGDRVVVRFENERVEARTFLRQTARKVELADLINHETVEMFERGRVSWISRIVWVRQ